jgi:trans-aconitate methyltransferase
MENKLSKRLEDIINALPLFKGARVLEIGCGPGAAAREISKRIGNGHILAIDRSEKAIRQAITGSQVEIKSGRLSFRQVAVENFELEAGEQLFDIAFAIRVGAFDGRHPEIEAQALTKIANAMVRNAKLFIDGGHPLKEILLEKYKSPSMR